MAEDSDFVATGDPLDDPHIFQRAVETVDDYAILLLDPAGYIRSWNPGAERFKGYRADEAIGRHFSIFYPQAKIDAGFPEQELAAAVETGRFEDEGWRVRKDGSMFWASMVLTALRDESGELVGFAKVTRDISERKRYEDQLRKQSEEILDLSTPVVEIWDGIVAVPLIGTLDSQRTSVFMERLLDRIVETRAQTALIDTTGVPTIDTQTAQHLIDTIAAVRLLGSQVVLTGVRPAIAQTLVHLGIDLSGVTTRTSMAAGLKVALSTQSLSIVRSAGASGAS